MSRQNRVFVGGIMLLVGSAWLTGCASYTTPGAGISMQSLARADGDIAARMTRQAAAPFPARLAVARVQAAGYSSYRQTSYGRGAYSVVTSRDTETEADFQRLAKLPMIAAIAPLNRMILPADLQSDRDVRLAAASLKTDILLTYSFDTSYRIDGREVGPLGLITLGALPIDEAIVNVTASAALFDVRTGFVYGVAESTVQEKQLTSAWSSRDAVDDARIRAERKAFEGLLTELEKTWKGVVEQHAGKQGIGGM